MHDHKKTILIGCGTGRCGTVSLSRLVNSGEGAVCTHERRPLLPWVLDEDLLLERIRYFEGSDSTLVGDVAYFHLPYLERLLEALPEARVICLERDRKEVIESFLWWTNWQNRWQDHDGIEWVKNPVWDLTYPKFDMALSKSEAIGEYWDHYHAQIRALAEGHPGRVRIFEIEALNSREGQDRIFDFLGVQEARRKHPHQNRHNTRKATTRPASKEEAFEWMCRVSTVAKAVASATAPGGTLILVDDQMFGDLVGSGRTVLPFLERNGEYWGPPEDDDTAISELQRLRKSGADFIAFGWPTFWWLDHYGKFHDHLRATYECVLRTEHVVIFSLGKLQP